MRLTLDERVKLQILLTAAGYWPAVPDADFSTRLFNAILRFEVDNGFTPLGVLNDQQMDRLTAIAAPYLNSWRFQLVRHPMTNSEIWVPIGLPLTEESTATGLTFVNRPLGVVLTYDFFPVFTLRASFESLASKLERDGARIYYSKLYRNEFFVFLLFRRDHGRLCPLSPDRARRRRFHAHLEPCGDGRPYRAHRHADLRVPLVVGVRRSLHFSVHRQDRERGSGASAGTGARTAARSRPGAPGDATSQGVIRHRHFRHERGPPRHQRPCRQGLLGYSRRHWAGKLRGWPTRRQGPGQRSGAPESERQTGACGSAPFRREAGRKCGSVRLSA